MKLGRQNQNIDKGRHLLGDLFHGAALVAGYQALVDDDVQGGTLTALHLGGGFLLVVLVDGGNVGRDNRERLFVEAKKSRRASG